jgi:hypothetical protein
VILIVVKNVLIMVVEEVDEIRNLVIKYKLRACMVL